MSVDDGNNVNDGSESRRRVPSTRRAAAAAARKVKHHLRVTSDTNLRAFLAKRTKRLSSSTTMVNLKECNFDSWATFARAIRTLMRSQTSMESTTTCRALNVSNVRCDEEEDENGSSSFFLERLFECYADEETEETEEKKNDDENIVEHLREMNVSGNEKAFRNEKGRAVFAESLRNARNARVKKLNVSSCDVDDAFVESLLSSLRALKSLRALNLRNNKRLTDRSIDAIVKFCENVGNSCVLTDVNCSGGMFSEAAIKRMEDALERNAVGYLRRRLNKKGKVGRECNDTKSESSSDEEKENEDGVTAKSISNCNVTDGIFMSLFEDITTLNNIVVVVDVRNNQITEDGFKQFFEKFSEKCEEGNDDVSFPSAAQLLFDGNPGCASSWCKRLVALCAFNNLYAKYRNRKGEAMRSLGEVGFGCVGCEVIAPKILRQMQLLESIGLHHNDIKDEGCAHLAELFTNHENLIEVALYGNKIGSNGARCIVDAFCARAKKRLRGNSSIRGLEILDIGGNPIGNTGVRVIANLITREEMLVEVHVDHVGFNEEGAQELRRAMETRLKNGQPMRMVWAHGNNISDDTLTSLTNLCRITNGTTVTDEESSDEDDRDKDTSHTKYQPKPEGVWDARVCETQAIEATAHDGNTDATTRLKSNRIASYALNTYKRFCKRHHENAKGAACFAAFVAYEKSTSRVKIASLGVGTKFVPPDVAGSAFVSSRDDVVRDSHAEILARRNFLRYLYAEMNDSVVGGTMASSTVKNDDESNFDILEMKEGWFRKRDDVEIHLYVSTAPCGAASLNLENSSTSCAHCFPYATRKGSNITSTDTTTDDEKIPPGCVVLPGGVREAIGNPKHTLSCSDKIAIWCARGVQGSILMASFIKEPIVLSSVTCSRKFDGDRLFEATYGRTCCHPPSLVAGAENINNGCVSKDAAHRLCTQMASISIEFKERAVRARADVGESDESVSWCAYDTIARVHDGRTGLAISGRGKPPRASKHDLKMQFLKLVSSIIKTDINTAKEQNGRGIGEEDASVSLLKKRLQEHAFVRDIEETSTLPYAKLKDVVVARDFKSTPSLSFLAGDDVNAVWRDGSEKS